MFNTKSLFLSAFFALLVNNFAFSQTEQKISFYGKVFDAETKLALVGASVFIPKLKQGSISNSEGEFHFHNLSKGTYEVVFEFIGYSELKMNLFLNKNSEKNFYLKPTAIQTQEVTVFAQKEELKTTTVQTMTEKELDKNRGQTLGETVEQISGITILQTGPSISKPVIRGLHSQRILLLNDGVQQEGQQWGGEHAPEIDPFSISKIEVLKGAAGVEHGSGAIGGVVSVKPAELPTEQSLSGKILLDAFSNNRQASGSLMLQGYNGFGWRFQGSLRKAGSSKTPDFMIANSGFEEKNYSLTLGYQKFETHFSHFGTELGIYKGSHIGNVSDLQKAIETGKPLVDYGFSYKILPPKQKISHDLLTVKTQQKLEFGKIETQYGFQKNHRQEFDAHKPYSDSLEVLNKPSFELTLTTHTLETKFAHKPAKNFWGTLGVSGMRQGNIRNGAVVIIPNFRSYSGGIFGVENFSKNKLTANLGLRYDFRWVKVFPLSFKNIAEKIYTCKNFTAALGTAYDFTENLSVLVNFGTAWRPPSLNELYSNDVHHGAAQFEIGDLNLKNERSFNSDLTFRYKTEKNNFEISFYNNLMKNFIFLFPDSIPTLTVRGAFPTFRYKQAEAVLRGFDGTFTTKLTDFYELSANFSTVFGTNTDTNEPLFLMPSDRLKLANTFSLPNFYNLTNSYFEFSGNFVRKQTRFPKNVDYTEPPKGYTLFDFSCGTELNFASQKIEVDFSVKNIFDTGYRDYLSRYRYFIDDAGRNIVLKVQIPFGKN